MFMKGKAFVTYMGFILTARFRCYSSTDKMYPSTHSKLFIEHSEVDFSILAGEN